MISREAPPIDGLGPWCLEQIFDAGLTFGEYPFLLFFSCYIDVFCDLFEIVVG